MFVRRDDIAEAIWELGGSDGGRQRQSGIFLLRFWRHVPLPTPPKDLRGEVASGFAGDGESEDGRERERMGGRAATWRRET